MHNPLAYQVIKDITTGRDGESYDSIRVLTIVGCLVFLVLSAYATFKNGEFDMQSFGIGFGTLLGGSGAGIMMKRKDEPPAPDLRDD